MALCRNCGCGELEHKWGHDCGKFQPGGKVGHETAGLVAWAKTLEPSTAVKSKTNPKFHAALKRMAEVHDKKSDDYAHDGDRYSNFKEAAATAGVSVDDVFAVLIGVKLARLRELLKSGKVPNNESIQDTRLDLAVYSVLWLSYHEGV